MGIPEDIALFEQQLHDLIVKYEQYFLGVEKREPMQLREQVERLSRKYLPVHIVNTAQRFRYQSLVSRLNSYQQHWNRILRLIDEGRYSRERFRMSLHDRNDRRDDTPPEKPQPHLDPQVEHVYRDYISARVACNLPVETITPQTIAAALEKQRPLLVSKYNCSDVEFRVVIEEGKPKIKARPKK